MTDVHSAEHLPRYDRHATAFQLTRPDATEELMAWFPEVWVNTIDVWIETILELANAVEHGWAVAATEPRQQPSRYRYPAYTWAFQFAATGETPELAQALRAEMKEAKAIGPVSMAGFDNGLWADVMAMQPRGRIPRRT